MTAGRLSEAARGLLDRSRLGHLATADAGGRPHVVPLCYAREGEVLYFVVDEKPKAPGKTLQRLQNIAVNPAVALIVDVYDEDWTRLEYLLVRGRAAVVEDADEYAAALEKLRGRYRQYRGMRLEKGRNPIVRITVDGAHHWRAEA